MEKSHQNFDTDQELGLTADLKWAFRKEILGGGGFFFWGGGLYCA